jgi:epoxyqueuosine reductase QueG
VIYFLVAIFAKMFVLGIKKPLSKFMTDHKSNLELTKNSSANANTSTAERVPSQQLIEDLTWILTASGKQIEKRIKGSALARSGSFGLKRNAIVVARNLNLRQLIPIIQTLTSHTKLGALATQAIQELQNI